MKSAKQMLPPTRELPPQNKNVRILPKLPGYTSRVACGQEAEALVDLSQVRTNLHQQLAPKPEISTIFQGGCKWVKRRLERRVVIGPPPTTEYYIQVHIMGDFVKFATVDEMYYWAEARYRLDSEAQRQRIVRLTLSHRGRQLLSGMLLKNYGIMHNDSIVVKVDARVLGGMMTPEAFSPHEDIDLSDGEVDDMIEVEMHRHRVKDAQRSKFKSALKKRFEAFSMENLRLGAVSMAVSADYAVDLIKKHDHEIRLAENVLVFIYDLVVAKNLPQRLRAVYNFAQSRTQKSFTGSLLRTILTQAVYTYFGVEIQSAPSVKSALLDFKQFKNSELVARIHKISIVALGASVFDKIGMKVSGEQLHELATVGVEGSTWKSVDFVQLVLESLQFVCERGYQCMKMGTIQPLFHSGKTYEQWFDEVRELQRLSKLLNNLSAEGISEEEYAQRLDKAIEHGEAIKKALAAEHRDVKRYAISLLCDVRLLRSQYRARNDASAARPEPFGVLLYGHSSVMKSELAMIVYYHYSKIFNLPSDDAYRYVRNFNDEYWSGYRSSKWCVHLDDVAPFLPAKLTGPDPSICEMLQIQNTTAYITNQAELEDKGKIAVRARLVTASTNTEHLNAHEYYMNALAIRRRLPLLVDVKVKDEYLTNGMVDSTKIPTLSDGEYLNVWRLQVKFIVGYMDPGKPDRQLAKSVPGPIFDDIDDFLAFFGKMALERAQVQEKAALDRGVMKSNPICTACCRSQAKCACNRVQSQPSQEEVDRARQAQTPDFTPQWQLELDAAGVTIPLPEEEETKEEESPRLHEAQYMPPWAQGARVWPHIYPTVGWVSARQCPYCKDWSRQCKCEWHTVACKVLRPDDDAQFTWVRVPFLQAPVRVLQVWGHTVDNRALCWFVSNSKTSVQRNAFRQFVDAAPEEAFSIMGECVIGKGGAWGARIGSAIVSAYHEYSIVRSFMHCVMGYGWMRSLFLWSFARLAPRACRPTLRFFGDLVNRRHGTHQWVMTVLCCTSVFLTVWALGRLALKGQEDQAEDVQEEIVENTPAPVEEQSPVVIQGGNQSVPVDFEPMEKEFENQWDLHDLKLADRPDGARQISWKGMTDDEIARVLAKSTVILVVRDGKGLKMENRAFCVVGQWYATNRHSWQAGWKAHVLFGSRGQGIIAEKVVNVDDMEMVSSGTSDLIFVKFTFIPPKRDLRPLFTTRADDSISKGFALVKRFDGNVEKRDLMRIERFGTMQYQGTTSECAQAVTECDFQIGDCGSPWIGRTSKSTFIVGIHMFRNRLETKKVGCLRITQEDLAVLEGPQIQGGCPLLEQAGHKLEIGPLRKHSHVSYIEKGAALVYGTKFGPKRNPKSTVVSTCLRAGLEKRGIVVRYGAPAMDWRSYHKDLMKRANTNCSMDDNRLNRCVDAFYQDILEKLPRDEIAHFKKASRHTAINGQEGIAYVDAMNRKTSAGAPFYRNKKHFMHQGNDGSWDVTEDIHAIIDSMEREYKAGRRAMPLYASAQKDEPKALEKCADGARIFICSNLPWNILVRQYTLWFVRLCQNNRLVFEMAVGINPHSVEWTIQAAYLLVFGRKMSGAGDFSGYDKQMSASVILKVFGAIARLAVELGATAEDALVIMGIGYDIAFSFVDYDGDIIEFLGSNPSGHVLTVLVNCLVHSVYKRYVFEGITGKHPREFQTYVRLLTYGDDGVMTVRHDLPEFNHTSIQAEYAKSGIVYTMADKESASIPFIDFCHTSFLKRGWKVVDGRLAAPLEESSIWKSLSLHTASGSLCEEAQTVQAMGSAVREAAFHGREFYDHLVKILRDLVIECGLQQWVTPSTFPSYQAIWDRWELNSQKVLATYESRGGVPGLGLPLSQVFDVVQLLTEESPESAT